MGKTQLLAVVCALSCMQAEAWAQFDHSMAPAAYAPGQGPMQGMSPAPVYGSGPAYGGPQGPGPYGPGPATPQANMPMPDVGGTPAGAYMDNPSPYACHDWIGFGEFMYMRPRNATVAYGTVFNGPPDTPPGAATPVQVAPTGQVSLDYQPAWRAGLSRSLDETTALEISYSHFQGDNSDTISTDTYEIRSLVSHPSTWTSNSASDYVSATATDRILYDLGDVDFRWVCGCDHDYTVSMVAGVRYASLKQDFEGDFTTGSGTTENVITHIHFEGAGLRFGLEGEKRGAMGLYVYGKSAASLVAGSARTSYVQSETSAPDEVDTGFKADRIVPILDAEVGVGWTTPGDRLRISAGYMFSGWFNVVKTNDFIQAVQSNNFNGMSQTLTFDGFVGRAEVRL